MFGKDHVPESGGDYVSVSLAALEGMSPEGLMQVSLPRALHILRHTFCSWLAMRGAPTTAIQELAGHESLPTTQRYMHLSPAAKDAAISLLDTAKGKAGG